MDSFEKYQNVFLEAFETEKEILNDLKYQDIPEWDSMGHMTMISLLEDEFDIVFETDDIIDFSSYDKGMEILERYDIKIKD